MKRKISYLFVLAALVFAVGCSDDDKETVNTELTLYLADGWAPTGFYMNYGTENATFYEVCDAPDLYANATYKEGLELVSQFYLLNEDKSATLTPLCTSDPEVEWTWSAVKVQNGEELQLKSGNKTIHFSIKSYGGDNLDILPLGYGLPDTFIMRFERSKS